jgi:hypothetical protein
MKRLLSRNNFHEPLNLRRLQRSEEKNNDKGTE